jgi:predicted phosphodiesterase
MPKIQQIVFDSDVSKILLFGGVYSNIHALKALQNYALENDFHPKQILCTGDIAGYCAFPNECFELIDQWGIYAIQGNVEENLLDGLDDCGCNFEEGTTCDFLSKNWFAYTSRVLTKESKHIISKLPKMLSFEFAGKSFLVLHGSYPTIAEFVFASTPWSVKEQVLEHFKVDCVIGGHCGLPFATIEGAKSWINPGVIGMPANDGQQTVWFATVTLTGSGEMTRLELNFHQLCYDYESAYFAMLDNCLPSEYAQTLKTGIWDNCDVLPDDETANQGKPIELQAVVL